MSTPVFHCSDLDGGVATLPEEEAHHARSVLRLAADAEVLLVDGKGTQARGRLLGAGKRDGTVEITERTFTPERTSGRIHLAVAPTKHIDRFEWLLEKATEIGVDRITPLITERLERHRLRHDRLEKVLVAAMKQSQRAWLPMLDELTLLEDLLREPLPTQRLFGWCEGERVPLVDRYDAQADAVLLIGPEGDFTPREAQRLVESGFSAVTLGAARLRTETAAIAACTWMNFAQQRS